MNKNIYIYDIETYKECFIICFFHIYTKEEFIFEISYFKNELSELKLFLKNCDGLIGFNNINFDYPVLHNILTKNISNPDKIYNLAKEFISNEFSSIKSKNVLIPQLDLYKIWHFDNKAKATSLKQLEFVFKMKNIQELPYDITDTLDCYKINKIIEYCKHDIKATYNLYLITIGETDLPLYKGKNQIEFRKLMCEKYNFNFLNHNDVKMGEEINKLTYLKLTGKNWNDIKDLRTKRSLINIKDLIPSYIKFNNIELQKLLEFLKCSTIDCSKPKLKYKFNFANNSWLFGLGGIHTEDKGRIVIPNHNQIFCEKDVSLNWRN